MQFNDKGQAMLSPLRFHDDSETFNLPVRLGLLNADGAQDLLVHILAHETRYELANYRNVAIPTNLEVNDATRRDFAGFYAALFDRTLAAGPAVVTEYAWSAGSCDPCPQAPLSLEELTTLGAVVLPSIQSTLGRGKVPSEMTYTVPAQFVLTRLHARYGRENLGEDLVFRATPAIEGGREVEVDGELEQGARPASHANNFQARYIIRHAWAGPISCENPNRGVWGGPPTGVASPTEVARDLAFARRDAPLATFLAGEVPADQAPLPAGPIAPPPPDPRAGEVPETRGCGRCDASGGPGALAALLGGALLGLLRRRRGGGR